jgi:hypothetical protein
MQQRPVRHHRVVSTVATLAMLVSVAFVGIPASQAVNIAQDKIVNPNPENWTPNVLNGQINSIVQIGNQIYAGGQFTQVQAASGGTIFSRSNLFSFNATTGAIDTTFAPTFDNIVTALAVAPDGNLFVGGYFNAVNGDTTVKKLVKLNPTTGQRITAFSANANGQVWDIKVSGTRLFVGGRFTLIKNVARDRLAAVNVTTGAVDPDVSFSITDPHTSDSTPWVYSMDVSPDGSDLVIIGNFMKVNGLSRPQAALLNLSTTPASPADWQTDRYIPPCSSSFDTYMRDVDFSPDGSYFVIVSTGGPNFGTLCDTAARWETSAQGTALQPTWIDATGGDTLTAVAITGPVVYVGGHQRWMNNWFGRDSAGPGAVPRPGVAALDPVNGLPFSWNPGKDRGVGVFALYSTNAGLWMGSDTDRVAGELRRRLAFFPLAGGKTPPPTDPYTLPGDLYNVPIGAGPINSLPRHPFDGSTIGAVSNLSTPSTDWSSIRGIFALQGELFSGSSNGTFSVRGFDGTSVGPPQQVSLNGLTDFPVQSLTGLFYANGRIYYTVTGDSRMFFRYFTPESRIVGSDRGIVGALTPPVDWSLVRGMTLANGKLYFARPDGNLYSMGFANGAPVQGTEVLVSPASAGFNWASNGLFVFTHVTAGSAVFADDFSSGNFSKWTGVTNLTIDNTKGGVAPPSALAQPSAQTAFAFENLAATYPSICMSANVNAATLDPSSTTLLKLRTAANGPITRVFANSGGVLYVRSDASNTQQSSGVALGSGWHAIEVCGTVGASATWDLYRDGVKIVNAWTANTGTTPVGRVEIGNTQAFTATVNFDDVVVDQTPG